MGFADLLDEEIARKAVKCSVCMALADMSPEDAADARAALAAPRTAITSAAITRTFVAMGYAFNDDQPVNRHRRNGHP